MINHWLKLNCLSSPVLFLLRLASEDGFATTRGKHSSGTRHQLICFCKAANDARASETQGILDKQGLRIRSEWIQSVANKFADALSGQFPLEDLQIRLQLRHSVQGGMRAPSDAFKFRPVGENPVFLRHQTYRELAAPWERNTVRLLCPPVDLIIVTIQKVSQTAPVVLLIPHWTKQAWYHAALKMVTPGGEDITASIGELGRSAEAESTLAAVDAGNVPILTTAAGRIRLADAAAARFQTVAGMTGGASAAADLVEESA